MSGFFFFLLLCITKECHWKQLKLILSHHFMTWGNFQSVNLPPFTDSLNAIQSQFNLESDWHVSLTVSNIVRAGLDLTHRLVITYPHLDRVGLEAAAPCDPRWDVGCTTTSIQCWPTRAGCERGTMTIPPISRCNRLKRWLNICVITTV